MTTEANPVVLLSANTWHIVEHSRRSKTSLCGRSLQDRRAHSRLKTVGSEHICPKCIDLFRKVNGNPKSEKLKADC